MYCGYRLQLYLYELAIIGAEISVKDSISWKESLNLAGDRTRATIKQPSPCGSLLDNPKQ